MYLKYFYNKNLAQASYMVGCAKTGEALIVDPGRDSQQYLDAATQEDLRITHVTETHIHADFVSYEQPLYFVTPTVDAMHEALKALRAISIDNVLGTSWAT
ncbi:hypothetical protein KFU94_61615 [Chloroflexi bacterium TSY]|nr:hypothetical protein [Chloroflexi bacterium TSY]